MIRTEINSDTTCARREMFMITETLLFTNNGIITEIGKTCPFRLSDVAYAQKYF